MARKVQADAIREILRQNPDAKPEATAKLLRGKGYRNCKAGTVSSVKYQMRRSGEIPGGDGEEKPRAGGPTKPRQKREIDKVSLKGIIAAKKFVDDAGGIDQAKKMIAAIESIGGTHRAQAMLQTLAVLTD